MGVKNLLPNLKSITESRSLRDYAGKVLGIDAKPWLYRAAMTSPKSAAEGKLTSSMLTYLENCVSYFKACGAADLLFVFDGYPCRAKRQEDLRREERRDICWQLAQEAEHNHCSDKADYYYKQCVRIGHIHLQAFLSILTRHQIPFLIAPYEADAQLAYFSLQRAVDVVVSEDSDMLAFGCLEVMFKCDFTGNCQVIRSKDLARNVTLSFDHWSPDQFLAFCCLSGCDYLPSLPGVGIKTAHRIVSSHSTLPAIEKAIRLHWQADDSYVSQLWRAMWTFRHQLVYDPIGKQTVHLSPLRSGTLLSSIATEECMGPAIASNILVPLVTGKVDPRGAMDENLFVDWSFEVSLPCRTPTSVNWMTDQDRQLVEASRKDGAAAPTVKSHTRSKRQLWHNPPDSGAAMFTTRSPLLSRRFRRMPQDEGVRVDCPGIDLPKQRKPDQPHGNSSSFFDIFFEQSIAHDGDPIESNDAPQQVAYSEVNWQLSGKTTAYTCEDDSAEVVDRTSAEWRIEDAKRRRIERLFNSSGLSDA